MARLTVGYLVNDCCARGTVAAIYPDAVNVLLDDGLLLSFVDRLDQMTAMAILLPDWVRRPPVVGAAMNRSGGRLRAGSAELWIHGGPVWRGQLRGRDVCVAASPEADARVCLRALGEPYSRE